MKPAEVTSLVAAPWDDLRAARVERRVLEALRPANAAASTLEVGGVSSALEVGAHVVVQRVTATRVELRHVSGAVAYEVRPRSSRLVVHIEEVRLETRDGAFCVEMTEKRALFRVSRGSARVASGGRIAEVSAGQQLVLR